MSEAQSGDREAQYWLALIFHQGKFVARSDEQFFGWLTKSAEQGYAPAQQLLQPNIQQTDSMTLDRDRVKSEMFLLRGAEQGNADSQFWLGVAYEQNWFGTADNIEAAKWLRLAAEQGHPDAQTSLGQAYEYADGVEQNYALAAKWYRKAAEHVPNSGGAGVGIDGLARLYEQGLGVHRDYVQAYMWFRLADNESAVAELRSKMTETQILEAERITQEWKSRHPSAIMALSDSVTAE